MRPVRGKRERKSQVFFRSDDPVRDWDRYCEYQEREMSRYPRCAKCGERILDEYCYEEDGEYFCDDCFDKLHRVETPVFDEWED